MNGASMSFEERVRIRKEMLAKKDMATRFTETIAIEKQNYEDTLKRTNDVSQGGIGLTNINALAASQDLLARGAKVLTTLSS